MGLKFGMLWSNESVSIGSVVLNLAQKVWSQKWNLEGGKQHMTVSSEWKSEAQEGNLREGFREWREPRVKV